ncbi:MAG TPA: hypothetical protein VKN62_11440 [Pelovirga sp.]|nr:hypothetical protein [Pelovirga sp.]
MVKLKNILFTLMLVLVAAATIGCAAKDLSASGHSTNYDRPGFVTGVEDDRLWVFREGSTEAKAYLEKKSKPAKHVVRPGAGPNRMTVRSPEMELIDAYLLSKPGFVTAVEDGRLWVLREGSKEANAYIEKKSKPAKHVVRPGAGPNGMTIRAVEAADIDAYLATK